MSGVDPGPKGTTIRTVFAGQSCAGADPAATNSEIATMAPFNKRCAVAAVIRGYALCADRLHWLPLSFTAAAI
jgi:hypothetical protein